MKRVTYDVLLFISLLTLPWWVTLSLAFIGLFIFTQFYEFILASILMFSLFRISSSMIIAQPLWFFVFVSITYVVIQLVRRYIILYKS